MTLQKCYKNCEAKKTCKFTDMSTTLTVYIYKTYHSAITSWVLDVIIR